MAKSMIKKARTAAQKAATRKWQAAGAAKRSAAMMHGYKVLSKRLSENKARMSTDQHYKIGGAISKLYLRATRGKEWKNSNYYR